MQALKLEREVSYSGLNYFGQQATITFKPVNEHGLFWKVNGNCLPVDMTIAHRLSKMLRLRKDLMSSLEIFEHIGPLVFSGVDGVVVKSSRRFPPFRPVGSFWQAIKPNCKPNGQRLDRLFVSRKVNWTYPDKRNGLDAFTEIRPGAGDLVLEIRCNYRGLGDHTEQLVISEPKTLERIYNAKTQGWPASKYWCSWIAQSLGWPNHNWVVWPQLQSAKETLELFILHRAQDLLGALSLLCKNGRIFSGYVISCCSGHEADFHAIQEASKFLN